MTVLIAIGIFATLVLLIEGAYLAYQALFNKESARIAERLREWPDRFAAQQNTDILRKRQALSDIPWLNDLLGRIRFLDGFQRLHEQADSAIPLGAFVLLSILLAGIGIAVSMNMRANFMIGVAFAASGGVLPFVYLYWGKRQRIAAFQRQFTEALELMARALRAGHALSVGLKLVGDEFADPIGAEFKRAVEETAMGVPLFQALRDLAERVDSMDVKFFVTAVILQRETGGNLAEIMESLAQIIRKRSELLAKVRALSAEGKLSALILFLLPFAIGLMTYIMNPAYMEPLFTDPLGELMVLVGGALMAMGVLVTKNMIAMQV